MLIARRTLFCGALALVAGMFVSLTILFSINQEPLLSAASTIASKISTAMQTENTWKASIFFISAILFIGLILIRSAEKNSAHIRSLEQSHYLLVRAQELAGLSHWRWNINKNTLQCSPQFMQLLDGKLNILRGDDIPFLTLTHPLDRERLSKAIKRSLDTRENFSIDLRICSNDQHSRYINLRCEPQINRNEKIVGLFGTIQDISDRVGTEQNILDIYSPKLKMTG